MNPNVDPKCSHRKKENGMEFLPRAERFEFFYSKQKQAITEHILFKYNYHDKIVLRID